MGPPLFPEPRHISGVLRDQGVALDGDLPVDGHDAVQGFQILGKPGRDQRVPLALREERLARGGGGNGGKPHLPPRRPRSPDRLLVGKHQAHAAGFQVFSP